MKLSWTRVRPGLYQWPPSSPFYVLRKLRPQSWEVTFRGVLLAVVATLTVAKMRAAEHQAQHVLREAT